MDRWRCNYCGFETPDKAEFIRSNGDGSRYWLEQCCPQCCSAPAVVFLVGSPAVKPPEWGLEETNSGLYVWHKTPNGGRSSGPIIRQHQLANKPASMLRPGLEGSLWDHHLRLVKIGNERSKAFKAKYEALPGDLDHSERLALMDQFRAECLVGDYDPRMIHPMRSV